MLGKLQNFVKRHDSMTGMSYTLLHFDEDKKSKSLVGGLASLIVEAYVLYFSMKNLHRMVIKVDPAIISTENGMDPEFDNDEVKMVDVSKPMFSVIDYKFNNIKLDRESRKYLHVRVD